MRHLFLIAALLCAPLPALAHKVIAGVFPSGDAIEGELGFSNGDMAAGTEVVVTGPDGAELGRTITDEDGFFLFIPTAPVAHTFRADLGAGHAGESAGDREADRVVEQRTGEQTRRHENDAEDRQVEGAKAALQHNLGLGGACQTDSILDIGKGRLTLPKNGGDRTIKRLKIIGEGVDPRH